MITNTFFFLLFSHLFIIFEFIHFGEAVGGIAEMKALTGDAPYLGTGNQEQAFNPQYF
uniref:Candidate secreted effector n=1 Tax=Meloidogyne incognita TaxID=6306 RepID=A0A914NZN4_MELIC